MITKWKLFNFKSVRNETPLVFGPLTIFAGSNSSGKSTVLQSILLISQTLSSKISSRSVVLNGHLVKLGQFDDLRSFQSEAGQILVGWECKPHENDDFVQIACDVSFDIGTSDSAVELSQLHPQLFGCTSEIVTTDLDGLEVHSRLSLRRSTIRRADRAFELGLSDEPEERLSSLDFEVDIDTESRTELLVELLEDQTSNLIGCVLNHFLPVGLAVRYDVVKARARRQTNEIVQPFKFIVRRTVAQQQDWVISDEVIRLLREHLDDLAKPLLGTFGTQPSLLPVITAREWQSRVKTLSFGQQRELRNRLAHEDLAGQIQALLVQDRPSKFAISLRRPPDAIAEAIDYQIAFFSLRVKYLGPLRDEPKPLYPLIANVDPRDVGLRGEHTAAVFDLHKTQFVRYLPSTCFADPAISGEASTRTLEAAVLDWLRYMGVVERLETRDRGKLGHELKVTTLGTETPHDLTHVGVGVSQVLPILVMCLLAEPDTSIIVEQPELHLHPKVQTLLGDFFLSMAMLGKQIIVETHSEYIINRLRFRAASAEGDRISSLLKIYFAEKKEDTSHFRSVDVNTYGAITDWPEGFFDQSQDEAEEILRAATRKKKAERDGGTDAQRNN